MPELLFYGLFSLQHRGQESAGLAYQRQGRIKSYRSVGMVTNALSHYLTDEHPSRVGIGHVRYSTQGTNKLANAQPIVVSCSKGEIALAHNGNISNSDELQRKLVAEGSIFQSTSDTELLLHMIARSRQPTFREALHRVPCPHRGRLLLPPDARGQALRGARPSRFPAPRDGDRSKARCSSPPRPAPWTCSRPGTSARSHPGRW